MRKVMIATPSHDGRIDCRYIDALTASVKLSTGHGIELCPVFVTAGPVETLRNDLLAMMVQAREVTDIVWIDSDIVWHPEWLLRLLLHPVDVVGGTYPRKQMGESYVVGASPAQLKVDSRGLMQVNHLGCGFLRMTRRAVAALWTRGKPYKVGGQARREVFKWDIAGGERISEDVFACRTLRSAGFAINFDPSICCVHIGGMAFNGNFLGFVDRLKADLAKAKTGQKNVRKGRGAGSRR